jgi:hypothetical protein
MIGVLPGVVAMLLGTWLGWPTLTPIVAGAAMGVLLSVNAARQAALAGALAWGGVLVVSMLQGNSVDALGKTLGGAMGIPSWLLVLVTLLYPAILAASAAWLAQLAARRAWPARHPMLTPVRSTPPT